MEIEELVVDGAIDESLAGASGSLPGDKIYSLTNLEEEAILWCLLSKNGCFYQRVEGVLLLVVHLLDHIFAQTKGLLLVDDFYREVVLNTDRFSFLRILTSRGSWSSLKAVSSIAGRPNV